MNLYDIILLSASSALSTQNEDGSMPPGWNGPYHQAETPVRNTAHWLITFLKAHEITNDDRYKKAAKKCAEYLLSNETRPMNATFWHRKTARKDKCNGLIGQAWTIEALMTAGEKLQINKCKELAKEVFLIHPFDETCGLWKRVDIDGNVLTFDFVFNHQLWFAACGEMIASKEVEEEVLKFMDTLNRNLTTDQTGLIKHFISSKCRLKARAYDALIKLYLKNKGHDYVLTLEEGYQSFNLYAFALLKKFAPQHPFWTSNEFILILRHIQLNPYRRKLENNKYGLPYNPVGFENAFAIHTFSDYFKENNFLPSEWLSWQINEHFDFGIGLMAKNTVDPITLSARIYEATRLPNLEFSI